MLSSPETDPEQPTDDALADDLAQLEDRYKRARADLDNFRKRAARETERRVEEARASVIRDWLDTVDSVEWAMRIQSDGACYDGLQAVLQQMDAVLAREGVQRIGAIGDTFDPERHEAVAVQHATNQVQDRTIAEVQRSGYVLGGRVIRPAQVVVARAD
jgi:molecular chaperone GrpE